MKAPANELTFGEQTQPGSVHACDLEVADAGAHSGCQRANEFDPLREAHIKDASHSNEGQPAFDEARVGDVITLADGAKVRMGIDGETFAYAETDELFDTLPAIDDDSTCGGESTLRLRKGEQIKVQFLSFKPKSCRVVRHKWFGGLLLACPLITSEELLRKEDRGRSCHLCESLPTIVNYRMPVIVHDGGRGQRARVLNMNERMWQQLGSMIKAGVHPLERLFVAGRRDDEFGSYFIEATEEGAPKLKREIARPETHEVRVETEPELAKFAETILNANGIEPQLGRVAKWQRIFLGIPLVGFWWGRKKPVRSGYLDEAKARERMRDSNYLERMDEGWGIALYLTGGYAAIDLDRDEDVEEFLKRNTWVTSSIAIRGGRGIKFIVRLRGEYPREVIHAFSEGEHVGEFRGATTAILDNLHPTGKLYAVQNEHTIPEITFSEIQWPPGWTIEPRKRRDFETGFDENLEGGLLDLNSLKNVRSHPTKDGALQAECPACAEQGSDKSGNHLIIFNGGEGKYGCAVDQSPEHYSRIFELAKQEHFRQREYDHEVIAKLARMDALAYERCRVMEAERLGVSRITVLDSLVAAERAKQNEAEEKPQIDFEELEPWPEPVNGAKLLDEILNTAFVPYIVATPTVKIASTLFVLHTYAFDLGDISPILFITSPTRRCGKTTLFSIFARLVHRPLTASSASAAGIYRTIELYHPTLLIDEVDAFLKGDEQLRGLINSGHTREGAFHLGCMKIGDNIQPWRWTTWAPKIFSGIGRLAGTLEDRAIIVHMRRRRKDEAVKRLEYKTRFNDLRRKCARFVADNADAIRDANPDIPRELNDRASNNWTQLIAIADLAGGEWPAKARAAARELCSKEEMDEADDYGLMLLADMRTLFAVTRTSRMFAAHEHRLTTEGILNLLHGLDARPWQQYGQRGRELNSHQLASLLKPFRIYSRNIKRDRELEGAVENKVAKGYYEADFAEAFSAYLPPSDKSVRYSATYPENTDDSPHSASATNKACSGPKNVGNTNNDAGRSAVAVNQTRLESAEGKRRAQRLPYPVELPVEFDDAMVAVRV